jgi:SAM-dependent methyltransferase
MAQPSPAPGGFADIDDTADPDHYVRTVERVAPLWQAMREQTYALLAAREGSHLLDVGCGTGDVARELARRVGWTGRVVGVDRSEAMIRAARRGAEGESLRVEYQPGDVYHLAFADNTFDGCRAERVFVHLLDPQRALAEMFRVTRPGGRVVVADVDVDTLVLDAPDRDLTRRILNHYCDDIVNGRIGRQLLRLFKESGLIDIAATPHTAISYDFALGLWGLDLPGVVERARAAGVVSPEESAAWLEHLREAARAGDFFTSRTAFVLSGRKP